MRAILTAVALVLGAAALGQHSDAATKPGDGKCECGEYIEAPALCRAQPANEQAPCRKSSAAWFDQCVAWQEEACKTGSFGTVAKSIKLDGPRDMVQKFAGTWEGNTICPKQGTWNIMLSVRQQPDGSFIAKAATEGIGEFKRLTLVKGAKDDFSLLYSSVFKDSSYTGRLVSPGRLEGTVKIQEDCTWSMTKSP